MPPLFARLVDDAGLFPPEELPMAAAVTRHRHDHAAGNPIVTGRFLCPAARLGELVGVLPADDAPLPVALIAPLERPALEAAVASIGAHRGVSLAGVEGPLGDLAALGAVPSGVPCFVELPVTSDWQDDIGRVADGGHAAKVRCGGLRAELFPSADALGRFVHRCAVLGVPFKATAGLHHALPYRDERRGFDHHGFLNLLLAASRAALGADTAAVIDVLHQRDAAPLVAEATALTAEQAAAARRLFVAYGSCSTSEPLEDLQALGLITEQPSVAI